MTRELLRLFAGLALVAGCVAQAEQVARAPTATPVWIDTDPAVGRPGRDVDDGLALLQAFHSPELALRGVSTVFGNAPLEHADAIAREMVSRFGPPGLAVFRGAAGDGDLGVETPAVRALAAALEREALTVLVLGPATNVASLLMLHPELAPRITEVVAVAGRRPGQRFTTGTTNPRGHRDFNFEKDPEAFRVLLASGVPVVLAPFEISSKLWFGDAEVERFKAGTEATRWLATPARAWLDLWKQKFDVAGFNPFDTLAVAYLTTPSGLHCERLSARIEVLPDDRTEPGMQGTDAPEKAYLVVAPDLPEGPSLRYCHTPAESLHQDILQRILVE